MSEEHRKSPRIDKSMVVLYTTDPQMNQNDWDSTMIKNISDLGMRIHTKQNYPVGHTLYFLIKIPFKPFDWIRLQGRILDSQEVKTKRGDSVASTRSLRIEFFGLEQETIDLIKQYVLWFLKKTGGA